MIEVTFTGDYALFSRPECKVERATYSVPTPSAVRNMLDAICWRPQMRWIVASIDILRPIRFMSFKRNEVQSKLSPSAVRKWMSDPSTFEPLVAGAGQGTDGTPRNSLLLKDVAYRVRAYPRVFDAFGDNTSQKYEAMFNRRLEKGQCHIQPVLGCREFPARFTPPSAAEIPQPLNEDLGRMLYDIVFRPEGNRAVFFSAKAENGRIDTRPEVALPDAVLREEVLRCSYRH